MNVAEVMGLLVIGIVLLIVLLFSFGRNTLYISVQHFSILFFIFACAVTLMVYNLDPRESIRWDLLVHYDTLEKMRTQGLEYVLHGSEYNNLVLINAFFYLVALTGNFRLISTIPVFIDFMCALYLIQDQLKLRYGKSAPLRDCAFTAGVWFMSFGFMLSVSGVRCVLAMCLGMTGLYLDYYKREHRGLGIFLYLAAIMTHSLGVVIPLIRILVYVKNKLLLLFCMITACLLFSPVASAVASFIGIPYFRYLLTNIAKYWTAFNSIRYMIRITNSDKTIFICYIIVGIFNLYMISRIKRSRLSEPESMTEDNEVYRAWNMAATIAVLFATALFNALFTQRLMYVLAYSFPLTVPLYLTSIKRTWKQMVLYLFMLAIYFWMFFFMDLYIFIVNFTGVYFLDL